MDYGDVVLGASCVDLYYDTVFTNKQTKEEGLHSCLLLTVSCFGWYEAVCLGRLFLLLFGETISLLRITWYMLFVEMKALLTCRPFVGSPCAIQRAEGATRGFLIT